MRSSRHAKEPRRTRPPCLRATAAVLALATLLPALAQSPAMQPARRFDRLRPAMAGDLEDGVDRDRAARGAPRGTRLIPDISYGSDAAQRFDVYVSTEPPTSLAPSPVAGTEVYLCRLAEPDPFGGPVYPALGGTDGGAR